MDGTIAEYLAIGIEDVRTYKGKLGYQITREGLNKNILSTTGMTECNRKATPKSGEAPLVTNPDGDPARYQTKWSYASIIVRMMYLASNYRPEIQFAIHQCDRFTHNYRSLNEDAII